jgi:hypothetical protein
VVQDDAICLFKVGQGFSELTGAEVAKWADDVTPDIDVEGLTHL